MQIVKGQKLVCSVYIVLTIDAGAIMPRSVVEQVVAL